MTENRAIEIMNWYSEEEYGKGSQVAMAHMMAAKALEEIQQYRAIGTVEDIQTMKDNGSFSAVELAKIANMLKRLKVYEEIGTAEELKTLKEKNEPKIPNYEGDGYYKGQIVLDTWICPNCEKSYEVDYEDYDYCPNCGQRIDHSELTEDD